MNEKKVNYLMIILLFLITGGGFAQNDTVLSSKSILKNSDPIFPGCEHELMRESRASCTFLKIREFIDENLEYPMLCKNYYAVEISYTLTKEGFVDSVEVVRSDNPILDQYAIKVIRDLPKMNPALNNGQPIEFMDNITVRFSSNKTINQYYNCDDCDENREVHVSELIEFLGCYEFSSFK